MCATCGCEGVDHSHEHSLSHDLGHSHDHGPADGKHSEKKSEDGDVHGHGKTVSLEQRVLARNDEIARENRDWAKAHSVTLVNLLSSPGAGKTTLLERTIEALPVKPLVIEGDQATERDAERIRAAGARALQINTGTGCHLDAGMVKRALAELEPPPGSLVFIENVGNLVCPALFDLGENAKVVIVSVAEGDDKPLKYPYMFLASDLVVVQKLDLLPHVSFDVGTCIANARRVKSTLPAIALSARTGEGLASFLDWIATLRGEASGG